MAEIMSTDAHFYQGIEPVVNNVFIQLILTNTVLQEAHDLVT